MIARIRRHRHVASLLRDLGSPDAARGRHGAPRLLSVPHGPASAQPVPPLSEHGFLTSVAEWLSAPLAEPSQRPLALPAWHCTVQAHPLDPPLPDRQWTAVAVDVMNRTGLAPRGDPGGVRWIAARHGDHVHILATLARQDGGPLPPVSDHSGARRACYAAEDRLSLHSTRHGRAAAPRSPCPVGSRDTGAAS